jgi:hypothetical protein
VSFETDKPPGSWQMTHASTINSVQGRTLDHSKTLYIDPRRLYSNQHAYVMVSRAHTMDQIKMIEYEEEKQGNVKHSIHDRAIAEMRKVLLSGERAEYKGGVSCGDGVFTTPNVQVEFDNVVVEYSMSGVARRADLMLLQNNRAMHAIEVCSTNPVSPEKHACYENSKVGYTELHARDVINEEVITLHEHIDMEALGKITPLDKHACAFNKFKNNIVDGRITTNYETRAKGIGRLYPDKVGLTYINKKTRALVAHQGYIDCDMENAHPNVANQYAEKNGIEAEWLSFYCKNRESVLTDISSVLNCDRASSKREILRVLYGGGADERSEFLVKLHTETELIADHVSAEYPEFLSYVKRRFISKGKIKRCILSLWAQTRESELLLHMYHYAIDHGFEIGALIYDGFLIRKHPNANDELLRRMEEYTFNKSNYHIKLAFKEFDTTDEELPLFDDQDDINDCVSDVLSFLSIE